MEMNNLGKSVVYLSMAIVSSLESTHVKHVFPPVINRTRVLRLFRCVLSVPNSKDPTVFELSHPVFCEFQCIIYIPTKPRPRVLEAEKGIHRGGHRSYENVVRYQKTQTLQNGLVH